MSLVLCALEHYRTPKEEGHILVWSFLNKFNFITVLGIYTVLISKKRSGSQKYNETSRAHCMNENKLCKNGNGIESKINKKERQSDSNRTNICKSTKMVPHMALVSMCK